MKGWILTHETPQSLAHFHLLIIVFSSYSKRDHRIRSKNGFAGDLDTVSTEGVPGSAFHTHHSNDITSFCMICIFPVIGMHADHSSDSQLSSGSGVHDLISLVQTALVYSCVG